MIEKNYLKSKPICKVKFILPEQCVQGAKTVHLVGTFNDWALDAQKLRKQKTGEFAATLSLPVGEKHEFRYLVDGEHWDGVDAFFAKYENKAPGQKKKEVGEAVPFGRMGTAEDLTGMAVFLASDDAEYVVAQTYNVDGGNWMS